jgi:hypothetical protein
MVTEIEGRTKPQKQEMQCTVHTQRFKNKTETQHPMKTEAETCTQDA